MANFFSFNWTDRSALFVRQRLVTNNYCLWRGALLLIYGSLEKRWWNDYTYTIYGIRNNRQYIMLHINPPWVPNNIITKTALRDLQLNGHHPPSEREMWCMKFSTMFHAINAAKYGWVIKNRSHASTIFVCSFSVVNISIRCFQKLRFIANLRSVCFVIH